MQLHTLLHNIKHNKPVNFDQVVKRMPSYVDWRRVFFVELCGKNKHSVEIIDHGLFDLLVKENELPLNRAHAASLVQSSSHDVKCDSAYMLCFPAPPLQMEAEDTANSKLETMKERTLSAVAVSQKVALPMSFKPAKHAILIENQDCFFQFSAFIQHYRGLLDLSNSDIYFSGGSRILNEDLRLVLVQYAHIKCLFDYDLAGLKTAQLLVSKGYHNVEYLLPNNLKNYASLFTFVPPSPASLSAMLNLCETQNLSALAHIISRNKRFMEQEAMLTIDASLRDAQC